MQRAASAHLALALANSDEVDKQSEARTIADALLTVGDASVADYELAFMINRRQHRDERAEEIALAALERFGSLPSAFARSAYRFSAESGRTTLKNRLDVLAGGRNE